MKRVFVSLLAVLALSGISKAEPAARKFACSNVGGTAEWTINVDLDKKKAGFFDNDTWVVVKLVESKLLESLPPQWQHTFEGKDGKDSLRIVFNETRLNASVTFLPKAPKRPSTLVAKDGCKADESVDLED